MSVNRRRFLTTSAMAAAAATAQAGANNMSKPDSAAICRISSREFVIPGDTFADKLEIMQTWGFNAIELDGARLPERRQEIRDGLRGSDLGVSAVCSGYDGVLCHEDPAERRKAIDSVKRILDAAAEFHPTGLIIVPAFNGQTKLWYVPAREALISLLPELGEHAHQCGTQVLLEPLNRNESWYLRFLADAASICREINHPGVAMMGDFFHMGIEEPSDYAAFIAARDYLGNVHLGSRQRYLPGQDERDFRPGFRALKEIGYKKFISLECFPQVDPKKEIPVSLAFLRQQWREA
ncbi:MAG: TIM barrel protein [bacterium]|nr:TIM barrel protein [bacterium]